MSDRYLYDKKALKGLTVFPFFNEVKVREKHISEASDEMPDIDYNANLLAKRLHPEYQAVVISSIKEEKGAKTFTLVPDVSRGCGSLAYFRAGQYIAVALDINGAAPNRPYTICSNPKDALGDDGNSYKITVKAVQDGFVSDYILRNWKVGSKLIVSSPLGNFYYVGLRDAKNVVALAGGSGITPFLSMAQAIASGIEDFNLTILYGSRNAGSILLKDELEAAERASGGKVKLVNVLSEENVNGCEKGLITAGLIRKYAPSGDYSLFVCGPKAMYRHIEKEIAALGLPKRRVRYEVSGEYGDPTHDASYPAGRAGKEFKVHVIARGESWDITCRSEEPLLHAMEMAGVRAPSDCRSGECGWCHSRLISGEVYVPESNDGRRLADKKFGWIHPCVSYPLSDIEIEVFPLLG